MILVKELSLMKTTTLALTVSEKNAPKNNIDFDFKPTNTDTITKLVNKINIKKATGVDQISCKLLKAGSPVLNKHLTTLLNNTIKHSQFPNRLKEAQVVPLHKKK